LVIPELVGLHDSFKSQIGHYAKVLFMESGVIEFPPSEAAAGFARHRYRAALYIKVGFSEAANAL